MATLAQQAPGLYRRIIGDLVLTTIVDGTETFSFDILSKDVTEEEAKGLLEAANLPPLARMPVNAYVVQGGGRTVLIDAGDANAMGDGGRLHEVLAAAGVAPSVVDTILLTHAHPDHVGGLISPAGERLFPRAELVVHAEELAFWQGPESQRRLPHLQQVCDLARSTFNAYRSTTRTETGGEVVPGITMRHLPGHTPGHCGYVVESGGESVLIWGDIVHWPDIQIPRPEVTLAFDLEPAQMVETRRRLLREVASESLLVGGMHLNAPGFIRIQEDSGVYRVHEERLQTSKEGDR